MISPSIQALLKGKKFIVALNSEPYIHYHTQSGIQIKRGSGGAQHLMDYIMQKTGGLMIATSSGDADQEVVDKNNKIKVPPDDGSYTLKRVFLSKELTDGYYNGFSNQTLWPLCHLSFVKPLFEKEWWTAYKRVNEQFAESILEEVQDEEAYIWVNDYQLCLLPQLLKKGNSKLKIGTFWHIPWPIKELFSICPWSSELLEGLLASDFIGFHRETYVKNFLASATSELPIDILPHDNSMYYKKHHTKLGHLPAGIDYQQIKASIAGQNDSEDQVKKDFGIEYDQLIIGVDRIDYTKGLIERVHILDNFFAKYPEYKGKLVHLLIGSPTRQHISAYKELTQNLIQAIEQVNRKYSKGSWSPIYFVQQAVDPKKIYQYYHEADVCFVSSLDDGMNLVAKEYPICAREHKGALLLSKYTGSSQELHQAFLINPFNVFDSVEKLHQALTLSSGEKEKRIIDMRQVLQHNDIEKWAREFISKTLDS